MTSGRILGLIGAFALLVIVLISPALLNGYPLLFIDSVAYIHDGHQVLRGHRPFGARLAFYGAVMWPFHLTLSLWPAILAQAAAIALLLWLVVTRLGGVGGPTALLGLAGVTLLSTLPWYAARAMPDVFAGVVILCVAMLVAWRERLPKLALVFVWLMAALACSVHMTHVAVAGGLVVLAVLARLVGWRAVDGRGTGLAAAALLAGLLPNVVISQHYFDTWSPTARTPPFLLASLLADGTATAYLKTNCGTETYVLCDFLDDLPPPTADDFLWEKDSPWFTSRRHREIKAEEGTIVLRTFLADPLAVAANATGRMFRQVADVGHGVLENPTVAVELDKTKDIDWLRADFRDTRQHRDPDFPSFAASIDAWYLWSSLAAAIGVIVVMVRARLGELLLPLAAVAAGLLGNAAITGGVSGVHDRYQGRAAWVVWILLLCCLLAAWRQRQSRR